MKVYELTRWAFEPLLPPLYKHVRLKLLDLTSKNGTKKKILDVGGRKSPYTIFVPADITIIDLPRETEVQKSLHLGITDEIVKSMKDKRSNIENFIFGDMTNSVLESESYDVIVSVEVIEHVEEDDKFVSEISRVLKSDGVFILTTPNGDFVENHNPDHKRHYKKAELEKLLKKYFGKVDVEYAISGGYYRKIGLKSWGIKNPYQTILSMVGNVINSIESSKPDVKNRPINTHHLIAVAHK